MVSPASFCNRPPPLDDKNLIDSESIQNLKISTDVDNLANDLQDQFTDTQNLKSWDTSLQRKYTLLSCSSNDSNLLLTIHRIKLIIEMKIHSTIFHKEIKLDGKAVITIAPENIQSGLLVSKLLKEQKTLNQFGQMTPAFNEIIINGIPDLTVKIS